MKKRNKIFLIITGLLIVIVIFGRQYANSLIQRVILRELNTIKLEQKDKLNIDIGDVKVKLFLQRFILENVSISSNNSNLSEYEKSFKIGLEKLVVKVNDFRSVLINGELNIKEIELDHPRIDLILPEKKDTINSAKNNSFKSSKLSSIFIENFAISGGDFYLHSTSKDSTQLITSISKLDFELTDVFIDLKKEVQRESIVFEKLLLHLGEVEYNESKNHHFSAYGVYFSNLKKGVRIEKLLFRNKESIHEFSENTKENKTWSDAKLTGISLHIDLNKLSNKKVVIEKMNISDLDLELLQIEAHKKEMKFDYANILSKLKLSSIVDTFSIQNATINFSRKKVGEDEIDDYQLKNTSLELLHFSNDSLYLKDHPHFSGTITSKLWTSSNLDARFSLDHRNVENSFSLELDNVPQRKVKKYTKGIGIFRSGIINQVEFNFNSDSSQYYGDAKVVIQDLDYTIAHFSQDIDLKNIDAKAKSVLISAHYKNETKHGFNLIIDTLDIRSPEIAIIQGEKEDKAVKKAKKVKAKIKIDLLNISEAKFSYKKTGSNKFDIKVSNTSLVNRSMIIDLSKKGKERLIQSGNFHINLNGISLNKSPSLYIDITNILVDKKNNELSITGLRYKNNASNYHFKQSKNKDYINAYLEKAKVDIDIQQSLFAPIQCNKLTLVKPLITFIKTINESKGNDNLPENNKPIYPISIDKIEIVNADLEILANTKTKKKAKIIELKKLNGSIENFSTNTNRKLVASFETTFYEKSRLNLDIDYDQGKNGSPINIRGKIKDLSLQTLKKRLAAFTDLRYKSGIIDELDFTLQASKGSFKGSTTLNSISVSHLNLTKEIKSDWLHLDLDKIHVSFSKKENKALKINDFSISKPLIEIHHYNFKEKKNTIKDKKEDLFAKETGKSPIMHVKNISINNAVIHQFNGAGKSDPLTSVANLMFNASEIDVYDSSSSKLPITVKGLDLILKDIMVHSVPKHDMQIAVLKYDYKKEKLIINDISFNNKLTPDTFFKQLDYRKAWMELFVSEVSIDMKLKEVFSAHPRVPKATLKGANFTTIVNLALEVGHEEKYLPNRELANTKFPFTIDSILIANGHLDVRFREHEKRGLLQFNDITGRVSNLTTDPQTIKTNNEMVWIMDATLWQSGKTSIKVNYLLDTKDDKFSMTGGLDNLNMPDVNTLTKDLYGISVTDGIAQTIYFNINGNNDYASGFVQFDYDNLHLNLEKKKKSNKNPEDLKKVKKKDKLNESFFKNVVVNQLIRNRNNPEKGKYRALGEAYYKREKNKPIFNLMWFTLSSGMLDIAESGVIRNIRSNKDKAKKESE